MGVGPRFSIAGGAATVLLALGTGLLAAMFTLTDGFLFRGLPYPAPDRLIAVTLRDFARRNAGEPQHGRVESAATILTSPERIRGFGTYRRLGSLRLRGPSGSAVLEAAEGSANLLQTLLGSSPHLANLDSGDPSERPALLAAETARRFWGDARPPLPSRLELQSGGALRIVGLLPEGFLFPDSRWISRCEVLVLPPRESRSPFGGIDPIGSTIVVRLAPQVRVSQLQLDLSGAFQSRLSVGVRIERLDQLVNGAGRRLSVILMASALFVYLACAANAANLLLVRTTFRRREWLTRIALGAERRHLFRLLGWETARICAGAWIIGVALARAGFELCVAYIPMTLGYLGTPSFTLRAVLFASIALVVVGCLIQAVLWAGANRGLEECGTRAPGHAAPARLARLVAAGCQCAVGVLLISSAGLVVRSYSHLVGQETGLSGRALVATVSYPDDYAGLALRHDIDDVLGRVRQIVGIRAAGAAIGPMVDRYLIFGALMVRGLPLTVTPKQVTPGYFEAIDATPIAGRVFTGVRSDERAVVVSASLARQAWPDGNAVGQVVGLDGVSTVVGVVRDTLDVALDRSIMPTAYSLLRNPTGCYQGCNRVHYVMKVSEHTPQVETSVRRIVADVNRDAFVEDMSTIAERLAGSIQDRAFSVVLLGLFALTGLAVCIAGTMSVAVFLVRLRLRDLAIRTACGSSYASLLVAALGELAVASVAGVVAGAVGGWWCARLIRFLLFGIQPNDFVTLAAAFVVTSACALLAGVLPVRRLVVGSISQQLRSTETATMQ